MSVNDTIYRSQERVDTDGGASPDLSNDADLATPGNQSRIREMRTSGHVPPVFGDFEITGASEDPAADQPAQGRESRGANDKDEPSFDEQMKQFRDRMYDGARNSSLTPEEYARLDERMQQLDKKYNRLSKDGLTEAEQRNLELDMKTMSLRIFAQKHDNNDRVPSPDRIDKYDFEKRFENLHDRAHKGVFNGSLTQEESARREQQIGDLQAKYTEMKQDGLTDQEKRQLDRLLTLESLKMFHAKHDGDSAA